MLPDITPNDTDVSTDLSFLDDPEFKIEIQENAEIIPDKPKLLADTMLGRDGDSSEERGTVSSVFSSMKEGQTRNLASCPFCDGPLKKKDGQSVIITKTRKGLQLTCFGQHGHAGEKLSTRNKWYNTFYWFAPKPKLDSDSDVAVARYLIAQDLGVDHCPNVGVLSTKQYDYLVYDQTPRSVTNTTGQTWKVREFEARRKQAMDCDGNLFIEKPKADASAVSCFPLQVSNMKASGIAKAMATLTRSEVAQDRIDDTEWIAFWNGDFHPEHGFDDYPKWDHYVLGQYALPCLYISDNKSAVWEKFLKDVFVDDTSIAFLQEFIGACLYGKATVWQKHCMIIGAPSSGKSTFLNAIAQLFPGGAAIASPPRSWAGFGAAPLMGSKINIVAELEQKEMLAETALIRKVMTGDLIPVERKYQDIFMARPRCGQLFGMNELPLSGDSSGGLYRRFYLIEAPNTFTNGDDSIANKLANPTVISSIFLWAHEGYMRRKAKDAKYTVPNCHAQLHQDWREESSSTIQWGKKNLVESAHGGMSSSDLYVHYRNWCERCGRRPVEMTKFGTQLKLDWKSKRTKNGILYHVALQSDIEQTYADPNVVGLDRAIILEQIKRAWDAGDASEIMQRYPDIAAEFFLDAKRAEA